MKLPSFQKLTLDAKSTFLRFPFVILAGVFATCVIWSRTEDFRFALVSFLGISFLYAIAIFTERRTQNMAVRIGASVAGIALLVVYFISLPHKRDFADTDMMRFALFALVAHLLTAFAPFTSRNELNGFWQYNKTLFIRILATALYTGVLYGGLSLAIFAVRVLFDVDIDNRIFGDLFGLLAGVFSTWFFLAGIPADLATLEGVTSYPQGLKIFTQYVLLPLVTIYLIILYLYAGKILVTWELPTGWVSALILSLAVVGILSLLLLYPIRNLEGNAWIRQFNAWLYRLFVPLLVLLFMAIGRRIGDYGITEPRYFVLVLAIWLSAITLYFVIRRGDNIKMIPITLAVAALLASFGPWGAFEVSRHSQVRHLRDVLVEQKGIVDGKLTRIGDTLNKDVESEIYSVVRYLDERHAIDELREWAPGAPNPLTRDTLMILLGINGPRSGVSMDRVEIATGDKELTRVTGFDYALHFNAWGSAPAQHSIGNDSMTIAMNENSHMLIVRSGADSTAFDLAKGFAPLADSLVKSDTLEKSPNYYYEIPADRLVMDVVWRGRPARLALSSIGMTRFSAGSYKVESLDGTFLFSMAPAPPKPTP